MIRYVSFIIAAFIPLIAYADAEYTKAEETAAKPKKGPIDIAAWFNAVDSSEFKKSDLQGQKVDYAEGEVDLSFTYSFNPNYCEGFDAILSYNYTKIRWKDNPFFGKSDFNTVGLAIGYFSKRIDQWLWKGKLGINVDADHFDWGYTTYDFLAWGRYTYLYNFGVHIGICGYTGMRIDRVFPIIGIDWQPFKQFKLNLVFPVDVSAVYHFTEEWSIALTGRGFDARHRVGKYEPLPEGLAYYRNYGAELGVTYDRCNTFTATIHGGYATGGQLKIANKKYHNKQHFNFEGEAYAGGELTMNF